MILIITITTNIIITIIIIILLLFLLFLRFVLFCFVLVCGPGYWYLARRDSFWQVFNPGMLQVEGVS